MQFDEHGEISKQLEQIRANRKKTLDTHEWWIDILSFFGFGGCVLLFAKIATKVPAIDKFFNRGIGQILLAIMAVGYFCLHLKIKEYIVDKLSGTYKYR